MKRSLRFLSVVAAFTLLTLPQAGAQTLAERLSTGVKKLEAGCAADAKQFCGSVTPGEGRLFFCILAHEDKVSQKCDLTLYEASRNLDRALDRVEQMADACWNDIERSCANVVEGGGGILRCLSSKTDLSPACQQSMGAARATGSVGQAPADTK